MEAKKTIKMPYNKVRNIIEEVPGVDACSAGLSPVTFRFLTSKNKYVNIGLEEDGPEKCFIAPNINSYEVTKQEVGEAYNAIMAKLKGDSK